MGQQKHGIPLPVTLSSPWSMDANLMHVRYAFCALTLPLPFPLLAKVLSIMPVLRHKTLTLELVLDL